MSEIEKLRQAKKKAEDTLKVIEAKKLNGEITQGEYDAWKREFTDHIKKLSSMLEQKGVQVGEEKETPVDTRVQMYLKTDVQALLKAMLDGSLSDAVPVFDFTYGDRYPRIEEISNIKADDAKLLVGRLYEAGVLQREFHDAYVKCPKCNSFSIRPRIQCPSCGSSNLTRGEALEHLKCGYSDFTVNFDKKGVNYVCPKCKGELKKIGSDYERHEGWFKCHSCNVLSELPAVKEHCNACGNQFDKDEAVLYRAHSYKLSPNATKEVESALLVVSPIKDTLVKLGMSVESPATLTGFSGAKHQFMVAIKEAISPDSKPIIIDIAASEQKVDVNQVLSFFAKACDIDSVAKLLVGVPGFNDDAKKVASSYGIVALEAGDRSVIASLVTNFAQSVIKSNPDSVRREIEALRSALKA
jgi:Zn finger protein HypA/HybF involved in hydrogenase expression